MALEIRYLLTVSFGQFAEEIIYFFRNFIVGEFLGVSFKVMLYVVHVTVSITALAMFCACEK